MKAALIAYRLVAFRVSCYFFVPFFTLILTQTETWSGETWDDTHWFLKIRLLIAATIAGTSALVAYIDQSLKPAQLMHQALSDSDKKQIAAETNSEAQPTGDI